MLNLLSFEIQLKAIIKLHLKKANGIVKIKMKNKLEIQKKKTTKKKLF